MPFPSPQGTQAAIAAMLRALSDRGDAPTLWTYAHGEDIDRVRPVHSIKRLWDLPRDRSLRSGPSLRKVGLDMQLAVRLALEAPSHVIAHHVEAATAAWLARRPFVFFAHTDLGAELPLYATRAAAPVLASLGTSVDRHLGHAATHVAAISPQLARSLETRLRRSVIYVPTPWSPARDTSPDQQRQARQALGLSSHASVLLYAGNLDAYQGWELLIEAMVTIRRADSSAVLVVATASDPAPLQAEACRAGVHDALVVTSPLDEACRERCHDAADLCLVPRRAQGGLPIKLLDALSRSVPIVAARRACAGLPLDHAVQIVADDSGAAIAAAALELLPQRAARQRLREAGSAYLREHHSPAKFLTAFDRLAPI